MKNRRIGSPSQEQEAKALLLFMVVLGYFITFFLASSNGVKYQLPELLLGLACGAIYAVLAVFEEEILGVLPANARNTVYFPVQILLVFGIGWLLGPGGNWMIAMPLAGMAVLRLKPRWRWPVYAGVLASGVMPIGLRYSTWAAAGLNALIIAAALFFVVLSSHFRLSEQAAREKAENLVKQLEAANRKMSDSLRGNAGTDMDQLQEPLSEREIEVLRLVAAGMSNREIAERLVISAGTAKTHIHHLCGKLGVRNRTEAAMKARELQLV